jgi:hypothetical protein
MSTEFTRPSSISIVRNSSCDLPVFRSVSFALIASLVRSADINAVDALSTRLRIVSSRTVARPVAWPPPPRSRRPCMPQDQPSTSISFLWALSCASPAIAPAFEPETERNMSPAPGARAAKVSDSGTPTAASA